MEKRNIKEHQNINLYDVPDEYKDWYVGIEEEEEEDEEGRDD